MSKSAGLRSKTDMADEITVLGSMAVLFSFGPALDLISGGVINTKALLTAALPLEEFSDVLNMVRKGEGVKTQILPNGQSS